MSSINLAQIDDYMRDQIEKLVRAAVLDAEGMLKEASPVDTGRFRSNWQTVLEPYRGSVYNNLPYAEPLANGHSPQAPAGWVQGIAKDIQTRVSSTGYGIR